MNGKSKREADGLVHSKPGSVDQQNEDSFPASDAPSFSPGVIGAPSPKATSPTPTGTEKNKVLPHKKSPA